MYAWDIYIYIYMHTSLLEMRTVVSQHTHVMMQQAGRCRQVVTSGSLYGVIVSTVARGARDVGSIPALDAIFSHFNHPPAIDLPSCKQNLCLVYRIYIGYIRHIGYIYIYIYIYMNQSSQLSPDEQMILADSDVFTQNIQNNVNMTTVSVCIIIMMGYV